MTGVFDAVLLLSMVISLTELAKLQLGKEGKDYFYNEAEGRVQSCPEFCDLPTDYTYTCSKECHEYTPKNRTTPAPEVNRQGPSDGLSKDSGQLQDVKTFSIPFIVTVVCIIAIVITSLVICRCFGERMKAYITTLKERLCERMTMAVQEEGTRDSGDQNFVTVLQNVGEEEDSQAADDLLPRY